MNPKRYEIVANAIFAQAKIDSQSIICTKCEMKLGDSISGVYDHLQKQCEKFLLWCSDCVSEIPRVNFPLHVAVHKLEASARAARKAEPWDIPAEKRAELLHLTEQLEKILHDLSREQDPVENQGFIDSPSPNTLKKIIEQADAAEKTAMEKRQSRMKRKNERLLAAAVQKKPTLAPDDFGKFFHDNGSWKLAQSQSL
jgi:hypothetical protein